MRSPACLGLLLLLCAPALAGPAPHPPAALALSSPGSRVRARFWLGERSGKGGVPLFELWLGEKQLLAPSVLGLELRESDLSSRLRILRVRHRSGRDRYRLPLGKARQVDEPYREYTIDLENSTVPGLRLTITFRLYRDGAAFRYSVPALPGASGFALLREDTRFTPSGEPTAYALPLGYGSAYEAHYKAGPLGSLIGEKPLGLPLALSYAGAYLLLTEADLHDYANAYLAAGPEGLSVELPPPAHEPKGAPVRGSLPLRTPWRVLLASHTPARALESNLVTSLNPPSVIEDASWIRPGKILFQWWNGYVVPGSHYERPSDVLNEGTLKGYVDFCARNGIPYLSIDGYEFDKAWYGGTVLPFAPPTQDIVHPVPEVNLPEVLRYARSRGILIRLWLHGEGLTDSNLEQVLSTYAGWGVAGVMVDFLGDDTQQGVAHLDRIMRTAARLHLTVSLHGVPKPTGLSRTYPNLLTEESVMGQEYNKWEGPNSTPEHEVYVGLIRGAVGPMDTHQGSFRPVPLARFRPRRIAPNSIGTLAHQLATYVAYENEQPMLADYPEAYERHPGELAFVRDVPVSWDETRVLAADLGRQRLVVARRSGKDWYLGALAGAAADRYDVPLTFLGPGRYTAEVYSDAPDSPGDGEAIARSTRGLTSRDRLALELAPAGGQAVRFRRDR